MSVDVRSSGYVTPATRDYGEEAMALADITAELFDLDARMVPAPDMTGSNTTTQCTDNGCSSTCPSVGCTKGCR
ncbi:MAG: hypothetical protein ACRDNZ_15615 [Streptosporangiaceae bacterium]